jgi:hypothetical protein
MKGGSMKGYRGDPHPTPSWLAGPRTRVDELRSGQQFAAYDGKVYTFTGRSLGGAYFVTPADGRDETCFAGCAEVVVQEGS